MNERVHIDTSNYTAFSDVINFGDSIYIFTSDAIDASINKPFIRLIATDNDLNELWRVRIIDSLQGLIHTNLCQTLLKKNDTSFYFCFSRFQKKNINLINFSISGEIIDSVSFNLHTDSNTIVFNSKPFFLKNDSVIALSYSNNDRDISIVLFDLQLNILSVKSFEDPLFPGTALSNLGWINSTYKDSLLLVSGMRLYNQTVPGAIPNSTKKVTKGWIKMYDTSGNELYSWLDTNLMSTQPKGIVPLKDGRIIAVNNYGVYNPDNNGKDHGMKIFCLDAQLNLLWEKKIDTNYLVNVAAKESHGMILTKDSSLLIVGRDAKAQGPEYPLQNDWPGLTFGRLTKVDLEGNVIWNRFHYNITYPEQPYGNDQYLLDVEQTLDSGFIAVGVLTKNTDCQANITPCQFGWVLKTDKYGCIVPGCHLNEDEPVDPVNPEPEDSTEQEQEPILLLHPNPANTIVHIYFKSQNFTSNGEIRIIDISGNKVKSFEVFKNDMTYTLPIGDLSQGTYIVQYMSDQKTFKSEKLVIVR